MKKLLVLIGKLSNDSDLLPRTLSQGALGGHRLSHEKQPAHSERLWQLLRWTFLSTGIVTRRQSPYKATVTVRYRPIAVARICETHVYTHYLKYLQLLWLQYS